MQLRSILCPGDFSEFSAGAYRYAIIAERTEELDKLISDTELRGHNVRLAVEFGKPCEETIRYANEEQTSLIIMTAREGDAADRAVFGSTTYRVIQRGPARCSRFTPNWSAGGNLI